MNCASVFTGSDGGTTSTFGVPPTIAIGVKSLTASYGSLRTAGLVPCVPTYADHQRVAVGRRARRGLRPDDAAAAALVLDHDRLAERLREALADLPRDEVDAAAGLHRAR